MEMVNFCNVQFRGLKLSELLKESDEIKLIFTANAQFLVLANENRSFMDILNRNYTTFDGQVPYLLAKLLNRNKKFDKLSGSDIVYDFLNLSREKSKKIFFLGGTKEANRNAIAHIKNHFELDVYGYSPPYQDFPFDEDLSENILFKIREASPDILFVGFGAPKQEFWIYANRKSLEELGIRWVIGSGGTIDFVSQAIKRAPRLIQKFGLEGVWRLLQQPSYSRVKRLVLSFRMFKYL